MANKQVKAEKLVNSAVTVFAEAIANVEKANDVLQAGVQEDLKKVHEIDKKISDLQSKRVALIADKNLKQHTMKNNDSLIAKLQEFAGAGE